MRRIISNFFFHDSYCSKSAQGLPFFVLKAKSHTGGLDFNKIFG